MTKPRSRPEGHVFAPSASISTGSYQYPIASKPTSRATRDLARRTRLAFAVPNFPKSNCIRRRRRGIDPQTTFDRNWIIGRRAYSNLESSHSRDLLKVGENLTKQETLDQPSDLTEAAIHEVSNPIRLVGLSGGSINSRIASKTTLNCLSYFFSSSSRRCCNSV